MQRNRYRINVPKCISKIELIDLIKLAVNEKILLPEYVIISSMKCKYSKMLNTLITHTKQLLFL